jgi:hypothetical protein
MAVVLALHGHGNSAAVAGGASLVPLFASACVAAAPRREFGSGPSPLSKGPA